MMRTGAGAGVGDGGVCGARRRNDRDRDLESHSPVLVVERHVTARPSEASLGVSDPTSHSVCVGCRAEESTEPFMTWTNYYGETRECTRNDYEDIAQ